MESGGKYRWNFAHLPPIHLLLCGSVLYMPWTGWYQFMAWGLGNSVLEAEKSLVSSVPRVKISPAFWDNNSHFSLTLCPTLCPRRLTGLYGFLGSLDLWVSEEGGSLRRDWQEIRRHGLCLCTSLHSLLATPFHRGSCHQDLVTRTWPSDKGWGWLSAAATASLVDSLIPRPCKKLLCEEFSLLRETLGMSIGYSALC